MGSARGLSEVGQWPDGALAGKAVTRKQGGSSRCCAARGRQKMAPKGARVLIPGTFE